jgi:hypothetical protein
LKNQSHFCGCAHRAACAIVAAFLGFVLAAGCSDENGAGDADPPPATSSPPPRAEPGPLWNLGGERGTLCQEPVDYVCPGFSHDLEACPPLEPPLHSACGGALGRQCSYCRGETGGLTETWLCGDRGWDFYLEYGCVRPRSGE